MPLPTQPVKPKSYKIVPVDVDEKSMQNKVQELREFLAANLGVKMADQEFDKAAIFQQHLDTLATLTWTWEAYEESSKPRSPRF